MAAIASPVPSRLARVFARHGVHYGWVVVGVLFVALLVASGIRSMPGVLILPIEGEFGWDRASITIAVSINLVLFEALGPLVARCLDSWGPREITLIAVVLLVLGGLGTTVMTQLWQLHLLWGLVVGAGAGTLAMVLVASVVNRWFVARRGLVTGLLSAGDLTGEMMFVPLIMWLAVTVGWRVGVLLAVALLAIVVIPLLVFLFRDDPRDVGLAAYGESRDPVQRAVQSKLLAQAMPMGQIVRTLDFWLLAGGFGICGFTSGGLIGTHFIPHVAEHGIGEVTAAGLFGLMGGLNIVGTIAGGMLCDRVRNRRYLLASYYAMRGVGLFALPFVDDARLLAVFAVLFGLTWFATGSATQILAADRFGGRSVPQVYGWAFFSHQVGSALAATWGGLAHNWFGDYQVAFISAGVIGLVAAGFSIGVREGRPRATAEPVAA